MALSNVLDDFEDNDLAEWNNVSGLNTDSTSYSGSYSAHGDHGTNYDNYLMAERGFGEEISKFRIYYKETSNSHGAAYQLFDSSGNRVCGFGTTNPGWTYTDGSSGVDAYSSSNYNDWHEVTLTFDYSAGTYDIRWENLSTGTVKNYTANLDTNNPVTSIEIVNVNQPEDIADQTMDQNTCCGAAYDHWTDYIQYEPRVSAPSQPQNVSVTVDANDQITVHWDEPDDWGGERGDYNVDINRDGMGYTNPRGAPNLINDDGSTSYSQAYTPSSDEPYDRVVGIDSSFKFRIRAQNSAGNSSWTYSSTVYTEPIPPHKPSVSRPDANTFEFKWTNKTDQASLGSISTTLVLREDTGSGYGNWQRFWGTDVTSKGDTQTLTIDTNTTLEADMSGETLNEDARYQFKIRYWNGSSGSENVHFDYGNNGNVYFEDDFESGDLSNWDSTTGANVRSDSGNGDLGISGADQGTYWVDLTQDIDNDGNLIQKNLGDLSGESDVIVKCVMATGSMDNSTEWTVIDWYDGSSWQEIVAHGHEYNKQGWVEVSALVPNSYLSTDNRIRLGGRGGLGGADFHGFDRVVISDILHEYTKPAAPTNLVSRATGSGELELGWTDNASFEDQYEIFYRQTGASSWTDDQTISSDSEKATITGLPNATRYELKTREVVEQPRNGSVNEWWFHDNIHPNISTPLGATKLNTPSGSIEVPVFDLQDVDRSFMRLSTPSGTGALNFVDPSNADLDQIRVNTESYGVQGLSSEVENE
ncbi:fibronectin type III domain-containing protein [Candidatus Nanohalobium constans]|uniref:Fibronectin type III domain-containing protein n=1 Tax=Candidatus Nanohalobium constans TaxID=2565781 RepID=A0A5Q0UFJ3_9ARCH|nr:fibronectin type III domain-containing protein [Candidatus Nanohalobium constans]QGA80382.1 fibronectin type III domain-containing protein [Candidatus Nanohalobium constans]